MLARKLLRDLSRHPGQALALALVFTLGIAGFAGIRMAYEGLTPATESLYRRLGLADVLAEVVFAPQRVLSQVEALPGVSSVEGRIGLETVAAGHPGVTVRVISLPAPQEPKLGKVEIVRGRYLSGTANELLIAEGAARYHGLKLGDELSLKTDAGDMLTLSVVGIVRQPEQLSMIPPGGFMAMPRSYMAVFVSQASAIELLGRSGGMTEFVLELNPGAEASVMASLRELLGRYRVTLTRGQDLASVRNIRVHLEAIGGAALVFPIFFLLAGALGGFILLSRIVRQERGLIGLLRALGYSPAAIGLHYLGYTMLLATAGGLLGAPLGLPVARYIRQIFGADLGTPPGGNLWQPDLILLGIGFALLSGALAGAVPAWAAAHIPPAEAMRPEVPSQGRRFRWAQLAQIASVGIRMSLRNLLRYPLRTLLTAVGVTFAAGLALAPALVLKEMNRIETRVQAVRQYDFRAVPRLPQTEDWLSELAALPGVTRAEGLLELPLNINIAGEEIRTYALGLAQDSQLMALSPPAAGQALLAEGLPESQGKLSLRGPLNQLELTAGGRVNYPLARPVVLRLEDAQKLLELPAALTRFFQAVLGSSLGGFEAPVTAALLKVAENQRDEALAALSAQAEIARIDDREVEREDLERIFQLSRAFIGIIEVFALLLGLALLYNTVVVNALERRRELSTLRVLGFRAREVGGLFMLETMLTALLGLALGIPLGLRVAQASMGDFPDFLPGGISLHLDMVAWVVLGTIVTVLLASWPVIRDLKRLELAEVVRERE